jgi:acetyltransferase-like isoleucine patch superfamily enzyme
MKISSIIIRSYSIFRITCWKLTKKNKIKTPWNLILRGSCIIDVHKNCNLQIGDNVILNSINKGYHINMYKPIKIIADRNGQISIGSNTRIHGTCIHAYSKISIGNNCLIAANTQIFDGSGHDLSLENPENRINTTGTFREIVIGNNVWIGAGCVILPGSIIGDGAVISTESVVRGIIPSNVLAGGNPIKVLKTI